MNSLIKFFSILNDLNYYLAVFANITSTLIFDLAFNRFLSILYIFYIQKI